MKQLLALSLILISSGSYAAQCRVDLQNQVTLDGEKIAITQADGDVATVDADNNVFIDGKKLNLTPEQEAAIAAYRQKMNEYLPRAKRIASDSIALADKMIDDIAQSLDAPGAFDDVKQAVKEFYADVEARYYKNGDLVLPAQSFDEMTQEWADDFAKAKEIFTNEFIGNAMGVLSEKMQQDGGLNLTELSEQLYALKARIEQRMTEYSKQTEQQSKEFCESLDDMAQQEQDVLKKVPELKDYQVFLI